MSACLYEHLEERCLHCLQWLTQVSLNHVVELAGQLLPAKPQWWCLRDPACDPRSFFTLSESFPSPRAASSWLLCLDGRGCLCGAAQLWQVLLGKGPLDCSSLLVGVSQGRVHLQSVAQAPGNH